VFPLSNCTELDVGSNIHVQKVPIVPLSWETAPVGAAAGRLLMGRDDRLPLCRDYRVELERAVSHPCVYPLHGRRRKHGVHPAAVSPRNSLAKRFSERQVLMVDYGAASMERKKQKVIFWMGAVRVPPPRKQIAVGARSLTEYRCGRLKKEVSGNVPVEMVFADASRFR